MTPFSNLRPASRRSHGRFSRLDEEKITKTIENLHCRVATRFPQSNLRNVCLELRTAAAAAEHGVKSISRPYYWLRAVVFFLSAVIVVGLLGAAAQLKVTLGAFDLQDFVQILESAINDMILTGAAIWFLMSLETRFKRRRALAHVHEMRAMAHVIDMHQLTKAPEAVLGDVEVTHDSQSQIGDTMDLALYMDYCSEMLSLTSKVAVLYVQQFDDPEVRAAVNEVEDLTTGLSRKIWQKMMVIKMRKEMGLDGDREA